MWASASGADADADAADATQVLGSAFAVASSLVMGKEGPMLHAGSILAVILGSR